MRMSMIRLFAAVELDDVLLVLLCRFRRSGIGLCRTLYGLLRYRYERDGGEEREHEH